VLLPLWAVPAFATPCAAVLLMPLLFLLVVKFDIVSGWLLLLSKLMVNMLLRLLHPLPMLPPLAFAAFVVARSLHHWSWECHCSCRLLFLLNLLLPVDWLHFPCFSSLLQSLLSCLAAVVALLSSPFSSCCPLILPALLLFPLAVAASQMFLFFLKKFAIAVAVAGAAAALAADNLLLSLRCSDSTIAACWHIQNGHWHWLIVASCKFDVAVTVDVLVTVICCCLTCHLTCCFCYGRCKECSKKADFLNHPPCLNYAALFWLCWLIVIFFQHASIVIIIAVSLKSDLTLLYGDHGYQTYTCDW